MPAFSYGLKMMFEDLPIRIRLFVMDNIVISKPEDIVHTFKQSAILTNKPYRKFVSNTFGVPEESKILFSADVTGLRHKPQADSGLKQEYRVDYLMHTFITQFMSGPSLGPLADRFTSNLIDRLEGEAISSEWKEYPDLYTFVRDHMFHASVFAMFGEHLFKMSENFCAEFWQFEESVPELAKGLPPWLNCRAIAARERCLTTVEGWRFYLNERACGTRSRSRVYDPLFGSEIVQKRHEAFAKMPTMSPRAIACEDLGLIWASTANAAHAAFWLTYQILRHDDVHPRLRVVTEQAEKGRPVGSSLMRYDLAKLCRSPLLQSLYAETLRLHVSNIILRSPLENFDIRNWRISPGEIIAMMSYPLHHDSKVYNTGTSDDPRPLDDFWADRFLVPRVATDHPGASAKSWPATPASSTESSHEFSLKGLEGSWIPYGGGSNICPGRQFAKQEVLLNAALLLGNYDVELTGSPVGMDWRFFGTGSMGVKGKSPFRIRKRHL